MIDFAYEFSDTLRGFPFRFKSSYGLFSAKKIDDGTRLLIDSLESEGDDNLCLDLGCGYGPIGMVLARLNPKGKVYLVDRDFVAVHATRLNCTINKIRNVEALLSDGFSNIESIQFDLIVSHLPTHISNEMLRLLLTDAKSHLKKNGRLYVVVQSRVNAYIKRELEDVFGNYQKIAHDSKYVVSMAHV